MVLDHIDCDLRGIYFSEFFDTCSGIFQAKWQGACDYIGSIPDSRSGWKHGDRTFGSEDGSFYGIFFVWYLAVELFAGVPATAKAVVDDAAVAGHLDPPDR